MTVLIQYSDKMRKQEEKGGTTRGLVAEWRRGSSGSNWEPHHPRLVFDF